MTRLAFVHLLQKFEAVPHEWKSFPNPSDTQQQKTTARLIQRATTYNVLFLQKGKSKYSSNVDLTLVQPTQLEYLTSHLLQKINETKLKPVQISPLNETTCCTVKNEKVRKTAKNVQREPRQRNDIMIHDPKFKTVFLPEMTLKKNPNLINN